MNPQPPHTDWARTDAALDELLAVPAAERAGLVERLAAGDSEFCARLAALAKLLDGPDHRLDEPAAAMLQPPSATASSLAGGMRLGAWEIVALVGRGGMGEVYRAERADGQFAQRAAIKLLRIDAAGSIARFEAERRILARLEHPSIARLLDGGVAPDGRPYMVMEYVEGLPIVEWCRTRRASLESRLALFVEVCAAVAFAHRHFVVHRDLKPTNVLVTADGRPKLLDFGIARLLDRPTGEPTRELSLTPGYASPEQLTGSHVTTATDVYCLGLLLHEMLCDRPAHEVQQLPLAAAIHTVLTRRPSPPSRVAAITAEPPVPARRLAGDLDAIVAKAVRAEPEERYPTADELRMDVERWQQHLPVQARRGSFAYVAGRAIRRHRALAIAASVAVLGVVAGSAAAAWQAHVARGHEARATAAKNFLVELFAANDPRVASDRPRSATTARELLDAGAGRIENEFSTEPELQLELLGLVSTLYRELGETERYQALQNRRAALAHRDPGRFASHEVEVLLNQVGDDDHDGDRTSAVAKLAVADRLLQQAGLDNSALRARWWLSRAQSAPPGDFDARQTSLERALALFNRHAPHDPGRVTTLVERGLLDFDRGDNVAAIARYHEALDSETSTVGRDEAEMQTIWGNLASAYLNTGQYDDAEAAGGRAADLARQTYGEHHADYWIPAANHARLLHLNGQRDAALKEFAAVIALLPAEPGPDGWEALAGYVDRLVAEGSAATALPLAERAERYFRTRPQAPNSVRRIRLRLGEAYEQLGRDADARRAFAAAYEEYVATEPAAKQTVLAATERWARFLVAHGAAEDARPLFAAVVERDGGRHLAHGALGHGGLARVALAAGDTVTALAESGAALDAWASTRGFRDVRMGPYLQRIRAQALLAAGDPPGAAAVAAAALEASVRFDAPDAPSVVEARALVRAAGEQLTRRVARP